MNHPSILRIESARAASKLILATVMQPIGMAPDRFCKVSRPHMISPVCIRAA